MATRVSLICGLLIFLLTASGTQAKVTPEEAAKLGKELTPLGAIRAGNADGTIPAWDGGITQPPASYKPGTHHPDPFIEEKTLLTITAANAEKYRDKLSPGQLAMLRRYPKTWRMSVYPTHRSASLPQHVYDATIANATTAELARGGNGVLHAKRGIPFPIPKAGVEAVWNHLLRYIGDTVSITTGQATPTPSGAYMLLRYTEEVIFPYYSRGASDSDSDNRISFYLRTALSPPRLAGDILLVHDPLDQVKELRQAWTYNPGLRRVRRAPHVAYDNPGFAADGIRTTDQHGMFNGAPDRYHWTLVGRREMYVPYNSYELHQGDLAYDDIIRPGHVNPDLTRYELHRVWVVEGKLKEGTRHIYSRRTFYFDEDSWQILLADLYDGRGEIWRTSEAHVINYYEVPLVWITLEAHYDLNNGRFTLYGIDNQEDVAKFNIKLNPQNFTPNVLRQMGRR